MLSEKNHDENEILGCLEELGLSKYESAAYYNLLGKGMISASEIAYCSGLPRTKIYFILKRMEKKKLVVINYQKPLLVRAVAPRETFDRLLQNYENRILGLKKVIDNLQQINDAGLKNKGIEEKKYLVLNQSSTLDKIVDLIKNTKESIDITINSWGGSLLKYTKEEIMKAIFRDVKVRIILDTTYNNENIMLPDAIESKYYKTNTNMFVFDNNLLLIINNDGTTSALFYSNEVFIPMLTNLFKESWNNTQKFELKT